MVGVWLMLALAVLATRETFVYSATTGALNDHQSHGKLNLTQGVGEANAKFGSELGKGFEEDSSKYDFELTSLDQDNEEMQRVGFPIFSNETNSEQENDKVRRPVYRCSRSYYTTYLYNAGDYGVFASPGYPRYYPARTRCGWTFRTYSPCRLRLVCPEVTMGRYAYFEVWDLDVGRYYRFTYARNGYLNFRGRNVRVGLLNQSYYYNRGFYCYVIAF